MADGNSALRSVNANDPLASERRTDSYAFGSTLNMPVSGWQLTATLDAAMTQSSTETDLPADTSGLVADALAGALAIDAPIPQLADPGFERALTDTYTFDSLVTASGTPFVLPAGEVSLTLDGGYQWNRIESQATQDFDDPLSLTRGRISGGFNLSVPLTSARRAFLGALGEISLSLGAGIDYLSDFGTLTDTNAGLNWRPTRRLTLSANRTMRKSAPSLTRLGAANIVTANVPIFDFSAGETALVSITSGGNPDLIAETQSDWKLSANYEFDLFDRADITVEYFSETSEDVTADFPLLTPANEAAFADRVTRDATGKLIAIDRRPITFAQRDASRLRTSFSLAGDIGKYQEPEGEARQGRGRGGARRGGGRGFGGGRPGGQGRWRTTLDHTYEIDNTVLIAQDGTMLDLLDGDALGSGGGVSRHTVSLNNFAVHKGIGGIARFSYRDATRVDGTGLPGSSDLFFGSLATLNLRMFADLQRVFPKTEPLKGMRVSFLIDNVFDTRQEIRDGDGNTPARFQPFLIDPTGRYIGIDVRKIF